MKRRYSLFSFLLISLLWSCNEEGELAPPTPPSVGSVLPGTVVDGDTLTIITNNVKDKRFVSLLIDGVAVTPISVVDSTVKAVVPYLTSGGKKSIAVRFGPTTATLDNAIEYLPFEFIGVSDPIIAFHPSKPSDTLLVKAKNMPKDIKAFELWAEYYVDGVLTWKQQTGYITIEEITDSGVILRPFFDPQLTDNHKLIYYLKYRDTEYKLENLSYRGYFKVWKGSLNNIPENEILIYMGSKRFSKLEATGFVSHVYLNGIKLKQYYHDPIQTTNGYISIEAFAVPPNIVAGEYELTVFELDGITPILPDSSNILKVSEITYCPEKTSYAHGEDIKLTIYPSLYTYRCYSCPEEIIMKDVVGDSQFTGTIKSQGLSDNNSSYFIMSQPADLPPQGIFEFELKSPNGYVYKVAEGCSVPTVTID